MDCVPVAHLDGVLTAGAGSSLDQSVSRVDDAADPVCVGVQLGLERLMFLMFTLQIQRWGGHRDGMRTARWCKCSETEKHFTSSFAFILTFCTRAEMN